MSEQNQNQVPRWSDPNKFWKDQVQRLSQRNLDLYSDLEDAELRGDKCLIAAAIFAVLFITTLGIFLL